MAKPRVIPVTTLSAFAAEVEACLASARTRTPGVPDVLNWYRGHGHSARHELKPSLYRHPNKKAIGDLVLLESRMGAAFRRQSMLHSFSASNGKDADAMMQLFYMQHHGVPTRLLDWSSNPFIALYFALADARRDVKGVYQQAAAVWVLDPYAWNRFALSEISWGDNGPADSTDARIKSYRPAEGTSVSNPMDMYPLPIALVGAANTPRMLAQRGAFTIFGNDVRPMEQIYDKSSFPSDCLLKLEIPAKSIDPVMSNLVAVGYTDSVAYPDLQGLAMEIKRSNGFQS